MYAVCCLRLPDLCVAERQLLLLLPMILSSLYLFPLWLIHAHTRVMQAYGNFIYRLCLALQPLLAEFANKAGSVGPDGLVFSNVQRNGCVSCSCLRGIFTLQHLDVLVD